MNYTFGKKQTVNDIGKRIGLGDIIDFVKKNENTIKNIGCVDLNDITDTHTTKIEKLKFQNFKKINYFPENLANIFTSNSENLNKYLHAGVLEKIKYSIHKTIEKKEINVSFYSSLLCCLNQSFLSQTLFVQSNFIIKLIDRLYNEAKGSKFKQFEYKKLGWSENELATSIANGETDGNVIKYLSDYFHVNIFILNLEEDKLYFGGGENYVPYKETIFLLKYDDDSFEPFFTEQSRTFSFNDPITKIIKKNTNKIGLYVISEKMNLMFCEAEENLDKYNHKQKKREVKDEIKKKDDKPVQIEMEYNDAINAFEEKSSDDNENDEIEGMTEQKMKKEKKKPESSSSSNSDSSSQSDVGFCADDIKPTMKVDELKKIAKRLKINTLSSGKPKTKVILMNEIKNKLKIKG